MLKRPSKNEVRNTVNIDTLSETKPAERLIISDLRSDEQSRLAALHHYDILDTAPELAFDDITLLAANICKAPIALVSFVDEHRQWFKSRIGIDSEQTARDISFCTHTIRHPGELFVVPDALTDTRFADSPLVADGPRIRFYAGAPLVAPDGHALGALCVEDVIPRFLDAAQQEALKALGRQVVTLLELRRSIRERRLLDERHHLVLESVANAIVMVDTDDRIALVNAQAEKMFGYSRVELIGASIDRLIPQRLHDQRAAQRRALRVGAAPGSSNVESFGLRKDGTEFATEIGLTKLTTGEQALRDSAGQSAGFLGLAIDISERKRIEDLLRAKNEDLKTFAYTVSHDLKAPLRGISGYAQELERRHHEGLGERARFCIAQIITASHNLDQLIEDLLHYSRLVAEKPQSDEVRLFDLVERILRDRSLALTEQGVLVDLQVPRLVLRTWERGLHQALSNLIDNALKYSRHAKPPRLGIRAEVGPNGCRIFVTDNGIGFDMKYHDRIFGLFNRLVRTSEFEGTGAGLAIVAKLLDKLGGSVRAESSPGEGAAFLIELPHLRPEDSHVH